MKDGARVETLGSVWNELMRGTKEKDDPAKNRFWVARCECRNGHNSSSGRCNTRDIVGTRMPGGAIFCDRCRDECVTK